MKNPRIRLRAKEIDARLFGLNFLCVYEVAILFNSNVGIVMRPDSY
jgi:hypothetical protein